MGERHDPRQERVSESTRTAFEQWHELYRCEGEKRAMEWAIGEVEKLIIDRNAPHDRIWNKALKEVLPILRGRLAGAVEYVERTRPLYESREDPKKR